ncbi:major coat protein [Methylomonas sp. MS20]|uniref:major coat protein n=1 Tax=unclassified Methylomonas TaxID=2608980 RepID=UPI0028A4761F|nr:major coat protein [Methylomonas sp. MV1]MDT4328325.1 major coat protein [Methylomonas sp. MV1]
MKTRNKIAFGSALIGAAGSAAAALPTAASGAFTTLQEDVLDLIDLAWPPAIAITVAFIVLRLFKKSANAAV